MNKHSLVAAIVALACSPALAQTGAPSAPQPMSKDMKPGAVMVTGCVAEGSMPGKFTLTNAMTAPPAAKDAMAAPDSAARDPHAGMAMSYALDGGDNLKAHVGHKVTVTGTVDKMKSMDTDKGAMAKPSMPAGAAAPAPDMMGGTLKVQAVKMVSQTCP